MELRTTEAVDPRFGGLDLWPDAQALDALFQSQRAALDAVGAALPALAAAVADAVPRLRAGGRMIYAGAGTSARIAVQDGAELLPTFAWPQERAAFVIAGGETALLQAVENAEDDAAAGVARMAELSVGANDVVIALAASGATPFTVAAAEAARAAGVLTIGIANTPNAPLLRACERPILVDTGAEPIAGSTRFKAGTAQKVVLNLLSTLIMVRLGRVYRGLMVDMRASNEKLRRRAVRMVMTITGCAEEEARAALINADHDIKLAVLLRGGLDAEAARALLSTHQGNLRQALGALKG